MPDNSELKKVGLKVTLPRLKVLGLLEEADEHHMSAYQVETVNYNRDIAAFNLLKRIV